MTVFYHQRLNCTRATSSWSDELLMIKFACVSVNGRFFPTASCGLSSFCIHHAEALICRCFRLFNHRYEQKHCLMLSRNLAEVTHTPTLASDCNSIDRDSVDGDMRGHKRIKDTLASRLFLARRIQHNQGALPPVEFDRACAARRKQSP